MPRGGGHLLTAEFWAFLTPPEYPGFANYAQELYSQLGSVEKVGKVLGVSKTPLFRVFRELGMSINPHGGYRPKAQGTQKL